MTLLPIGCTDNDKDPIDQPGPAPITSGTEMGSKKATNAPAIDGNMEAAWDACDKLVTSVVVPDPGSNYFQGYVGTKHDVTMRSMYDDNYIYFLAEWSDANKSLNRDPWYFDPTTKKWAMEKNKPVFVNGVKTRDAFYEDKFAMLFNVGNSVAGWDNLGCYASCHVGLDPATHGGATARHYTNSANEIIDMWHWKSVRTGPSNQVDDQFQNNTEFDLKDGGRHGDPSTSGGYSDNKQKLPVTGGAAGDSMVVPLYVIPGATNYYWILKSDQDNGTAKKITGVDNNGVLTYSGGTIDPNTDAAYQRSGATTGAKSIPSVCSIAPFVGSRGDIEGKGIYTGNGWILEMKRKMDTGSDKDVKFESNKSYVFGIGVFENAAIAHAINSKLLLKFK
ncbi:MAG: ethylbenzene dehydrogenase-related protein [Bacteroidia bacterium]